MTAYIPKHKRNLPVLKTLVRITLFTAFTYVLGLTPAFSVPIISVPIVIQNMAVFLAGSLLGASGAISMVLLLVLVAAGLPVLAGGRGGVAEFFGPTVGFLVGYVIAALVIGILVQKSWIRLSFFKLLIINVFGLVILYGLGIVGFAFITQSPFIKSLYALWIFVPLDIVKIVFSCFIAMLFRRYYPLLPISKTKEYTGAVHDIL